MFGEGEGVEVSADPEPDFPLGVGGGDVGHFHLAVTDPDPGEVLRHGGDDFPLDLVRLALPLAGLAVGIYGARALGHALGDLRLFLGQVEGGGAVVVDFVVPPCLLGDFKVAIVLDHVVGQPVLGGVADFFHGGHLPFTIILPQRGGVVNPFPAWYTESVPFCNGCGKP